MRAAVCISWKGRGRVRHRGRGGWIGLGLRVSTREPRAWGRPPRDAVPCYREEWERLGAFGWALTLESRIRPAGRSRERGGLCRRGQAVLSSSGVGKSSWVHPLLWRGGINVGETPSRRPCCLTAMRGANGRGADVGRLQAYTSELWVSHCKSRASSWSSAGMCPSRMVSVAVGHCVLRLSRAFLFFASIRLQFGWIRIQY